MSKQFDICVPGGDLQKKIFGQSCVRAFPKKFQWKIVSILDLLECNEFVLILYRHIKSETLMIVKCLWNFLIQWISNQALRCILKVNQVLRSNSNSKYEPLSDRPGIGFIFFSKNSPYVSKQSFI